jgi:transposase-like protein
MSSEAGVSVQQRRTRSEIAQIVEQFAESGLTRSEFCRRHGLCLGTLNRHLKRMSASKVTPRDGLVAVELVGSKLSNDGGCGVAVVLSRGRRIEVSAGFDAPTLQRLVALLENM